MEERDTIDAPDAPRTSFWLRVMVGLLSLLGALAGAVGGAYVGFLLDAIATGGFWTVVFVATLSMVGALVALFLTGRFVTRFLMPRDVANKVFAATAIASTLLLVGVIVAMAAEFA